jgi:hypothetical protein
VRPVRFLEPRQEAHLIRGAQMLDVVKDHGSGVVQGSGVYAGNARDVNDGERKSSLHLMDPGVGRSVRAGQ